MKKRMTALGLCFLLLLGVTACTNQNNAASYEKTIATARTEIWKAISEGGASSATVAISDNGKIVYKEGFAMANRIEAKPVDESTQFNIASISKMFSTMAVLQLFQEGKIELDQPVSYYLPEFTMPDKRYENITVRMLLNHTSELNGTYSYDVSTSVPDPEFTGYFMKNLTESSLKGDPGLISIYCNDGFTLAEVLVEKVSGKDYSDYLDENILSKAGLSNTSCYFKENNANIALNYKSDGTASDLEYVNSLGAGGMASTAVDLCKFGNAILSGKIVDQAYVNESFKPQYGSETVPSGTPMMEYGLGWDGVNDESYAKLGVKLIYKGGDSSQYHAMLYLLPEQNITVSVIFSGPANTVEVTDAITKALLKEKDIINTDTTEKTADTSKQATIPDNLMGYAGYYTTSGSVLKVDFNQTAGEMHVSLYSNNGFVLTETDYYKDDGYFYGTDQRYTLAEKSGMQFLMAHYLTTENGQVKATRIPTLNGSVDPSQFVNKQWIAINTLPKDTSITAGSTGVIPEIPGYVTFGGSGYYLLNQLVDARTTKINTPYTRDTREFSLIEEQGKTLLKLGSCKLMSVADVPTLQSGETITISDSNVCRRPLTDGFIKTGFSETQRIVVLSPTLDVTYDSLINGPEGASVTAGSFVIFIGNNGDTINYDYQVKGNETT